MLSPKQNEHFQCWVRPHELSTDPKIVVSGHVDYLTIKQTVCM